MNSIYWSFFVFFIICCKCCYATEYYIANSGSDSNNGLSTKSPLKTINCITKISLQPGDRILFKRNDVWREQLKPKSGSPLGYITYGAYGEGSKPLILGSMNKSKLSDWKKTPTTNIWYTYIDTKDVGNIIFDNEESCGIKKWCTNDLKKQGDFYFDRQQKILKLFSIKNPGDYYKNIECALRRHIIDQSDKSYIIYENLALKYGAAHGIGGRNTHHIIIRNCDISFIGGGHQTTKQDGTPVRYGNGIEFWGNAHDNLVENCKIWEVYDAALTNQNCTKKATQYNIKYINNTIWNCEYSYEYWNRPESSITSNISFEHNTCLFAGYGWGHKQRPDPSGRHLCFFSNTASIQNFNVIYNIFYEAEDFAFFIRYWSDSNLSNLKLKCNCWYQSSGNFLFFKGHTINTLDNLNLYPFTFFKDNCAKFVKPVFRDMKNYNFQQIQNSPCLNMGALVLEKAYSDKTAETTTLQAPRRVRLLY